MRLRYAVAWGLVAAGFVVLAWWLSRDGGRDASPPAHRAAAITLAPPASPPPSDVAAPPGAVVNTPGSQTSSVAASEGVAASPPSASAPPPPAPPAPTTAAGADRDVGNSDLRYRIRWRKPGLCATGGPVATAREQLLGSFREAHMQDVHARVAPEVDDPTFVIIAQALQQARSLTSLAAGRDIGAPPLVVYRVIEDLRRTACVHGSALAYYDGALHVSADVDGATLWANLRHEIVHHALVSRGVEAPMWLQEGLAMLNAQETWWAEPQFGLLSWGLRYHHPFARMVSAFPHTADESFASAVYFQSMVMTSAVMGAGGMQSAWRLVDALADGTVAPADAFAWGVQAGDSEQQERIWRQAVRQVVLAAVGPGYTIGF